MKTQTKKQPEKILISEDQKGVQYLISTANANAATLTNLLELDPSMTNEQNILKHSGTAAASAYVMTKFFNRFPQAKSQAEYSKIEFVLPDDLSATRSLLSTITARTFEMVVFDGRWIVDVQDLEAKIDSSYRVFASSPDEIERYNVAKGIADFLNNLRMDTFTRNAFVNDMIEVGSVNGSYGLVPRKKFIFAKHLDQKETAASNS